MRRLRAKKMIQLRVQQMSKAEIARQMNISHDTVIRELKWAERQGLIQDAEDDIIRDLVPLAVKVMKEALASNKVEMKERLKAADRVLTGTGVLKKEVVAEAPDGPKDEVEVWLMKRRTSGGALQQATPAPALEAGESGELTSGPVAPVVEAEVVEGDDEDAVPSASPVALAE